MAAPSTVKELQYRLDKAKRREAFKEAERIANPTPYRGKPDRTRLIYRDWYNAGVYIGVDINTQTLAFFGGVALAAPVLGLYTPAEVAALPGTPAVIPNKNIKIPMVKQKFFYGDDTPTIKTTGWGTRVVSFADKKPGNNIKYHQTYFSSKDAVVTLDVIVARFLDFWTEPGRMLNLLGTKGSVTLMLGDQEIQTLRP